MCLVASVLQELAKFDTARTNRGDWPFVGKDYLAGQSPQTIASGPKVVPKECRVVSAEIVDGSVEKAAADIGG